MISLSISRFLQGTDEDDRKLVALLVGMTLLEGLLVFFMWGVRTTADTNSYKSAMVNLFTGDWEYPHRYLRPLGLFLAYPLQIFGNTNAFAIESFSAQICIVPFLFKFVKEFTGKKDVAFLSTFLFLASPLVIYKHVLVALTDMETWCLYLITIFLFQREFKRERPNHKNILLISLLAGVSVLMKENGGSGIIFMFFMILFNHHWKLRKKEKAKLILASALIFVLPIFINQLIVYHICGYTYFEWLSYNQNEYPYSFHTFFRALGGSFGVLYLFAAYEFISTKKYRDQIHISLLLSILIPFFAWSAFCDRFLFLGFPFVLPLAVIGMQKISARVSTDMGISEFLTFSVLALGSLLINTLIIL